MTHDHSNTENVSPLANAPEDVVDLVPPGAANSSLNEDSVLALLQSADLPPESIEKLSKSSVVTKSRKARLAIVSHPKSPRYVSLSLLRKMFTFDLMRVALTPTVAGDLKMAAEEVLITRLEAVSAGEKLSLARRASGRVAGELLLDSEPRVVSAALDNPRLTEVHVTKAVIHDGAPAALVQGVCVHSKWSLRRDIRIALLRNAHTTPEHAMEFAKSLPNDVVREILLESQLPESVRTCLTQSMESPEAAEK
jgi:hypothetical protein